MTKFSILFIFTLISAQNSLKLEDGSVVQVECGGQQVGTLDSNPTTGYQWVFYYPYSDVFTVKDLGYSRNAEKTLIGSGGFQSFGFYADQSCQQGENIRVTFEYKREWESFSVETLEITVIC
jgi:predicted secreted protein